MATISVTLTDAQIKALPSTPFQIVAAPGPGKMILPISCILHLTWVADYTNITGVNVLGILSSSNNGNVAGIRESISDVTGLLANGQNSMAILAPISSSYIEDAIINDAFMLKSLNNAGNYTGGNAGNSLKVTLVYQIITNP